MMNPLSDLEDLFADEEYEYDPQDRNEEMAWLCYNFGLQPSEYKKLTISELAGFHTVAKEIQKANKKR